MDNQVIQQRRLEEALRMYRGVGLGLDDMVIELVQVCLHNTKIESLYMYLLFCVLDLLVLSSAFYFIS